MTPSEISRMKLLFERFVEEKFSDDPFWYNLALNIFNVFVIWLEE